MPATTGAPGASRFALLADRDFRRFFLGQSLSRLGDAPIPVAFAIASYDVTRSASGIAAVLLSLWVARLVMVGPGGALADRFNRVTMMLVADAVRVVAQGVLAAVVFSGSSLEIWHLCVASAAYGVGTALYVPAQIGFTPDLVAKPDLPRANALFGLLADVSFVSGPAVAGVLMATVGFGWVLVLDCVTFVANMLLIAGLRHRARRSTHDAGPDTATPGDPVTAAAPPTAADPDVPDGGGMISSVRLSRRYPWFGAGVLLWLVVSIGIGLTSVAGPAIALSELGGVAAWSLLSTCLAVGSLLGSLGVIVSVSAMSWRVAATVTAVAFAPQYLLLAGASPGLWLLGPAFVVAGLVTAACGSIWDAEYQARLPERHLSRLGSLEGFANTAAIPVGMLLAAVVADHYLPTYLVLTLAVLVLASVCAILAPRPDEAEPPVQS